MLDMLWQKISTIRRLGPGFCLVLFSAWVCLAFCSLIIFVAPFRYVSKLLGIHDGLAPRVPVCSLQQESRARTIGSAIRLAARYSLWRSDCFPQALAARFFLGWNRVPYAIFMGVRRCSQQDELQAHAWVVSGRVRVTGGAGFSTYTSVGCFVSRN